MVTFEIGAGIFIDIFSETAEKNILSVFILNV